MSTSAQHQKDFELFDYVDSSRTEEETFHFLGFEFLHRYNIVNIQNELISEKENIFCGRGTNVDKENLKRLLNDYTIALKNYNYIHRAQRLDHHTGERRKQRLKRKFPSMSTTFRHTRPFESHYYYLHDNAKGTPDTLREALRHWLPSRLTYSAQERRFRSMEYEQGKPPIEISPFVDNAVRLFLASVAVLVLVAPMCIMSVQPSLTKNLITASVFMVLFACGMSFGVKGTNVETLVATATYSAVLVVFVGTNSSGPPSQG